MDTPREIIDDIYDYTIRRHKEVTSFVILISFLTTFILARLVVYMMDYNFLPDVYLLVGQTHVHHLNYGIFLLAITGYFSLIFNKPRANEILAIFYGIGLGLTFDEFALWLHLQDDYSARASYEAIIVITVILINIVYFGNTWKRIGKYILFKLKR